MKKQQVVGQNQVRPSLIFLVFGGYLNFSNFSGRTPSISEVYPSSFAADSFSSFQNRVMTADIEMNILQPTIIDSESYCSCEWEHFSFFCFLFLFLLCIIVVKFYFCISLSNLKFSKLPYKFFQFCYRVVRPLCRQHICIWI